MNDPSAGTPSGPILRRIARRSLLGAAALAMPGLSTARAQNALGRPSSTPFLTISGRLRVTNEGDKAVFDREMLEALGSASITTNSPWYEGPVRFDGVPMARVMAAVGAEGRVLTAIALNDYSTDIPMEDFERFGVLLATRRDGAPMRISDRGPLFILYPYDANPVLRARLYYSRSAWSVAQMVVS